MPPEHGCLAWIGGSILCSLSIFRRTPMCTKKEWLSETAKNAGEPRFRFWNHAILSGDHAAHDRRRRDAARALVLRVPPLCRALPSVVLDAVCFWISASLDWPEVPSLQAAAFLPPDESEALGLRAAAGAASEEQTSEMHNEKELYVRSAAESDNLRASWAPVAAQLCALMAEPSTQAAGQQSAED